MEEQTHLFSPELLEATSLRLVSLCSFSRLRAAHPYFFTSADYSLLGPCIDVLYVVLKFFSLSVSSVFSISSSTETEAEDHKLRFKTIDIVPAHVADTRYKVNDEVYSLP